MASHTWRWKATSAVFLLSLAVAGIDTVVRGPSVLAVVALSIAALCAILMRLVE
jgi:hypothetical protein